MDASSVPPSSAVSGTTEIVPSAAVGTTSVVLLLEDLRRAASELGWTFEALASHVAERGYQADGPYVHKVLHGDKGCTLRFLAALPLDLLSSFYTRQVERLGHEVVPPLDHETARRYVVSGLAALLGPSLPARSGRPLKVTLGSPGREENVRKAAR
jgi:S-formylglutathione hydrolase FrmB